MSPAQTIRLQSPLDAASSLEGLRRAGDDLLDRWDGTTVVRTATGPQGAFAYTATPTGHVAAPALTVCCALPAQLEAACRAARDTFIPAPPEFAELSRIDPVIARLNAYYPGLRPIRQGELLAALVRAISAQQVNLAWAATTRRRLAERFGERHEVGAHVVYSFAAERLAQVEPAAIRALQFTTAKAKTIVGVARTIADGRLCLSELDALPDTEVIARLTALRGIGPWTAEWLLTRTLGRPRVVAGDLGVRKAVGIAYGYETTPDERTVRAACAHWGNAGAIAQGLILHAFAEGTLA